MTGEEAISIVLLKIPKGTILGYVSTGGASGEQKSCGVHTGGEKVSTVGKMGPFREEAS